MYTMCVSSFCSELLAYVYTQYTCILYYEPTQSVVLRVQKLDVDATPETAKKVEYRKSKPKGEFWFKAADLSELGGKQKKVIVTASGVKLLPPVLPFPPMYRSGHPKNQQFVLTDLFI